MVSYRCPHPSHAGSSVHLRSNDGKVFECAQSHRFFRRDESSQMTLVDLISGQRFDAVSFEVPPTGNGGEGKVRLDFMKDVPRVKASLDFNKLSLSFQEWKLIAKVDGRTTLEEARLLAGLKADEAERIFHSLIDAGVIEIRSRAPRDSGASQG